MCSAGSFGSSCGLYLLLGLKESLKYASVQISTANANGELYVWGYIPVVVAKWYVRLTYRLFLGADSPLVVYISKRMVPNNPLFLEALY